MQSRSSSTSTRTVMMVCLVIILIVGVLYFMKRVEANRLGAELDLTKTDRKEREESLNGKLTDYLHKMEEMTKQLGDLQAKLTRSEDEKSSTLVELQKVKKAISECQDQQASHVIRMGDLEDELKQVKNDHATANDRLQSHKSDLINLQQAAKDSEIELSACLDQSTLCQTNLADTNRQLTQVRALLTTCEGMQSRQSFGNANPSPYQPRSGLQQQPQQQYRQNPLPIIPKAIPNPPAPGFGNVNDQAAIGREADNGDKEADDEDEGEDEEDGPEGNLLGEGGKEDENYDEEPQEDDLLGADDDDKDEV